MPGITAAGSASGMDFESIIQASLQTKSAQLNKQVTLKKEETNIMLSGVGKLKSALDTFKKALDALTKDNGFNVRKVTSDQPADNPFFTISTKDDAANANYDITVDQLAASTKLDKTFDADTKFGKGKLTITLPPLKDEDGEYKTDKDGKPAYRTIELDISEDSTLESIRKKINDNDYGVTASIVTNGDQKKLIIDSGITGKFESSKDQDIYPIKIDVSGGDANLQALAFDPSKLTGNDGEQKQNGWSYKAGQDALISIDGEQLSSSTNQFNNISGMTITANRVSDKEKVENSSDKEGEEGEYQTKPTKVSIEQDNEEITKKVEEFVTAYNTLQQSMADLGKNNTYTDGKNNYDGGELAGDSMLRALSNQLQSIMTSFKADSAESLDIYSMGLEVDKDGVFKLDSAKFKENISKNFNAVVKIFTNKIEDDSKDKGDDTGKDKSINSDKGDSKISNADLQNIGSASLENEASPQVQDKLHVKLNKGVNAEKENQSIINLKDKEPPKEQEGLLIKLGKVIEEYTKSKGVLDNREEELNNLIKDYEAKEAKNAEYLETYEAALRQKYAKLDNTIAGYNNSLSYLQTAIG